MGLDENRVYRELGEISAKIDGLNEKFKTNESRLNNHAERIRKNELSAAKSGGLYGALSGLIITGIAILRGSIGQ